MVNLLGFLASEKMCEKNKEVCSSLVQLFLFGIEAMQCLYSYSHSYLIFGVCVWALRFRIWCLWWIHNHEFVCSFPFWECWIYCLADEKMCGYNKREFLIFVGTLVLSSFFCWFLFEHLIYCLSMFLWSVTRCAIEIKLSIENTQEFKYINK